MTHPDDDTCEAGRRSFMRQAGLAGLCLCGMGMAEATASAAEAGTGSPAGSATGQQPPALAPEPLAKKWVGALLPLLAAGDRTAARAAIRNCWMPHYDSLGMQATTDRFRGNLGGFLSHLQAEWGWIVSYSPEQGVILVDENKPACVCPVVPKQRTGDLGLMCYCSEGFAERLFSQVVGTPVRVTVVASVLRGDPTCKYRIDLKPS